MAKISIIIPVYNADRFLAFTLNSILKQSYQKFEVLLVDDGSTDSSSIICDEYAEKDNRFIVTHINNAGVSHARNIGISLASGEYIFFCDADDMLHPDALRILHDTIIQEDSDMCFSNWLLVKHECTPVEHINGMCKCVKYFGDEDIMRLYSDCPNCFSVAWGKLYKASTIQQESLRFNEKICRGEDTLFICSFLTCLCKNVVYVDAPLYNYREVEGSLFRTLDKTIVLQNIESFLTYNDFVRERAVATQLCNKIKISMSAEVINNIYCTPFGKNDLFVTLQNVLGCGEYLSFIKENRPAFIRSHRVFILLVNVVPMWILVLFILFYRAIKN